MTGFADAPLTGLSCQVGSGSLLSVTWTLNNGNVTCLTRYGIYGGPVGGGIGYDFSTGTLVVAGIVVGSQSVYGDYDAVILIYSRNLTLLNETIIGGNGCDSAAAVQLPYVLLSVPALPNLAFGTKTGPGLLSISGLMLTSTTASTKSTTSTTRALSTVRTESAAMLT